MNRHAKRLAAIFMCGLVGQAAWSENAPTLTCDTHVPTLRALLDSGEADDVARIMSGLFDDPSAQAYFGTLSAEAAQRWMAVLFHPVVLAQLVEADPSRIIAWDALADAVEAAYEPNAKTLG